MVKNTKGGNKAKKQGRKFTSVDPSQVKTRFSSDPDELYACCSKLLGNGKCRVMCIDGQERLCIIRNKFKGRGRRDNSLAPGTWCLVGRRSFEKAVNGKLENCDLLEVYGDIEKKKIKQKEINLADKWQVFGSLDASTEKDGDGIEFNAQSYPEEDLPNMDSDDDENWDSDASNEEFTQPKKEKQSMGIYTQNEEDIDVDDI